VGKMLEASGALVYVNEPLNPQHPPGRSPGVLRADVSPPATAPAAPAPALRKLRRSSLRARTDVDDLQVGDGGA
jgi:hypothetical protein